MLLGTLGSSSFLLLSMDTVNTNPGGGGGGGGGLPAPYCKTLYWISQDDQNENQFLISFKTPPF